MFVVHDEKGFTLIEILTSLYILGLVVFFTIPLFTELREYEEQQAVRLEVYSHLQEKMERLCSGFTPMLGSGKEERKSKIVPKIKYQLLWQRTLKKPNVYQIIVEIKWNNGKKMQQQRLCTHRCEQS